MIDPLCGCDPAELTQPRAGAIFSQEVRAKMQENNSDFVTEWARQKQIHPELYARLCNQDAAQAANVEAEPINTAIPKMTPYLLDKFKLPADTSETTWQRVWLANGGKKEPNFQSVYMAVCTDLALQLNKPVSYVRDIMQDSHAALAKAAGQI